MKFLAGRGAKVIVTDIKDKEYLAPSLEKLKGIRNIEYVLGQQRGEDFAKVDMVVKNPGIPWENRHVKMALERKIPVETDASLFFQFCRNPIIGVTGTKGKTTIATIIYEILKSAGKNPVKVGIGQASVLDKLDFLKKDSIAVFELSSWRLSSLERIKMSPHIAVFKNILTDHLNYYPTMEAYVRDKKNIFLYQKPKDWLIANEDDDIVRSAAQEAKSQIIRFSAKPIMQGYSVFLEEKDIYLNNGIDAKKLVNVNELKIRGGHNIANILAAIGASFAAGVSFAEIKKAIIAFEGVPHRLEFVRDLRGIKFFNDTAATIPDAVVSALDSFMEPIVLIAGGEDKRLDFKELGQKIKVAKKIILLKGSATEKLLAEMKNNYSREEIEKIPVVSSMEAAVDLSFRQAEKGDAVLLSPGAASFGLFLNEFDRGDKFKKAVFNLN